MLEKALAIANEYLPGKAQEIRSEIQQQRGAPAAAGAAHGGAGRVGEVISQARAMERSQNYSGAIQLYLSLGREHTEDTSVLEEAWERAVALAQGYARDRAAEVVTVAADKLVAVGRPEAAAELYQGINDLMGECRIYMAAGMWDRARERAASSPVVLAQVEEQQRMQQLRAGAQQAEREGEGGGMAALEYAFARGEADKVQQLVLQQLAVKVRQGDAPGALALLAKFGAPARAEVVDTYRALAREILAAPAAKRDLQAETNLRKARPHTRSLLCRLIGVWLGGCSLICSLPASRETERG